MSYSLNVRAGTKADAKTAVSAELDKIVAQQPVHAKDRAVAEAAASAQIDLIDEDETKDINVMLSGSLGGVWDGADGLTTITNANVSAYVALIAKDQI